MILAGCQNVKDTLSGKKKKDTDQFLIKKKDPLVLPPEFSVLPKPKNASEDTAEEDDIDLSVVLKNTNKVKKKNSKLSSGLEKSISEILNSK